jgi:hypothetical protein
VRRGRAAFAATALSAALAAGGCRPPEETRFLNFDPETTAGRLVAGWSGWEKTPENDTFVWAQARETRMTVTNAGGSDRVVRFRAWSFLYPNAPEQTVTLFVNGTRIDAAGLYREPHVATFVVPKALWKKGENELRFAFAWAEAPKDRMPGSDDSRTLAAAFDWLEILPPPSSSVRK